MPRSRRIGAAGAAAGHGVCERPDADGAAFARHSSPPLRSLGLESRFSGKGKVGCCAECAGARLDKASGLDATQGCAPTRHCERSEAIQSGSEAGLDCFVAGEQVSRAPYAKATSVGCGDLLTVAMTKNADCHRTGAADGG